MSMAIVCMVKENKTDGNTTAPEDDCGTVDEGPTYEVGRALPQHHSQVFNLEKLSHKTKTKHYDVR